MTCSARKWSHPAALILMLTGLMALASFQRPALAYPPAVGILGASKDCLGCHIDNGPWKDDPRTVIDIVDKNSKQSLKRDDGSFVIEAKRGSVKTVMTIIGRAGGDTIAAPQRNAWLYVDPKTNGSSSLSKFAPGWEVNLPMACRLVGDIFEGYENASVTVLPMTVRPTDAAQNADIQLQVMLTSGESVKGNAKAGMTANYFERTVRLRVTE
ncbi:MAG: hypothetical protein AB1644_04975 [Candidatus Zixiibacteriota bacterium]